MSEPAVSDAPESLYRVGRSRGLLNFSEISPSDALLERAGNRFDVAGGGVLYCATKVEACYAETLARYRPTPKMQALLKDSNENFMIVGGVPRDWRLQRSVGEIRLESPLPFLDMEDPSTWTHLEGVLAKPLVAFGYSGNLDLGTICSSDRRLSRLIATHAYTAVDEEGAPAYSGIRYMSRLRADWECWAIFDGTHVKLAETRAIELADPDLKTVEKMWNLRVF